MILTASTYGLTVVTAPTVEPVTLDDVRTWCRIDADDVSQDSWILNAIASARQRCEEICDRALMTQTLKLTLDVLPYDQIVRLPRYPLQSVTTFKYYDVNTGVLSTLASTNYTVDTGSMPGRIVRATNGTWPSPQWRPGAIEITYVAGYTTLTAVPASIRDRLKTYIAYSYENRETQDLEYLDRLLLPFSIGTVT